MIGFVIPFKGKQKAKHWTNDCALLRRTLMSVLNQTNKQFNCYVVYSDLPEDYISHEKIKWIKYPYSFLASHEIEDEYRCAVRYRLGKYLPNFFDQGKKVIYGSAFAKKEGCKYIMSLDADDLLSANLTAFVLKEENKNSYGWYVNKGYVYTEPSFFLLRIRKNMNYACGSVNIVRSDLVPEPNFDSKRYQDFQFFSSHAYTVQEVKDKHGVDLSPLPFYAIIYIIHRSNFYAKKNHFSQISLRNIAKHIIRGKFLSKRVRNEFGLYNISK